MNMLCGRRFERADAFTDVIASYPSVGSTLSTPLLVCGLNGFGFSASIDRLIKVFVYNQISKDALFLLPFFFLEFIYRKSDKNLL